MALKQRLVLRMRHLPFTDLLADGQVIPVENIWDEVGSPPPRIMHVVLRPRTEPALLTAAAAAAAGFLGTFLALGRFLLEVFGETRPEMETPHAQRCPDVLWSGNDIFHKY